MLHNNSRHWLTTQTQHKVLRVHLSARTEWLNNLILLWNQREMCYMELQSHMFPLIYEALTCSSMKETLQFKHVKIIYYFIFIAVCLLIKFYTCYSSMFVFVSCRCKSFLTCCLNVCRFDLTLNVMVWTFIHLTWYYYNLWSVEAQ